MSAADLTLSYATPMPAGTITVAQQVIAKLAGRAARATYGVVGMQESPVRKLARFFRGHLSEGVEVDVDGGRVNIGLHVVMERGLNLAQVTANVQDQVRYDVEQVGGVPVGTISVSVEDLQD